jgi:hemolysin III
MSLAAFPLLVVAAARRGDLWQVIGGSIYATTLVLLYSASTVYHALPSHFPAKRLFRGLDHGAIHLLIAGTYTPFALGALRGPWGWSLLATIWSLAAGGIVLKAGLGFRYPRLSTAVYLLMGWLIVVALRPLYRAVGPAGMAWLAAGGLSYTAGVYFYVRDYLRYRHFIWHLFVLAGSACHLVAVTKYANGVAPPPRPHTISSEKSGVRRTTAAARRNDAIIVITVSRSSPARQESSIPQGTSSPSTGSATVPFGACPRCERKPRHQPLPSAARAQRRCSDWYVVSSGDRSPSRWRRCITWS